MEGITGYFFLWGPTLLMVALFSTVAVRRIRAARRRREARQARHQVSAGGMLMRRQDRQLTDPADIERIIRSGTVCRVALALENEPYVVSLSYGASFGAAGSLGSRELSLYFHCASEGRKLDMIRKNPRACFTIEGDIEIAEADRPCDWSVLYESVVGYGDISQISDPDEKRRGLDAIMRQHGASGELDYPEKMISRTTLLKLEVESMTGKSNRDRQEADDETP